MAMGSRRPTSSQQHILSVNPDKVKVSGCFFDAVLALHSWVESCEHLCLDADSFRKVCSYRDDGVATSQGAIIDHQGTVVKVSFLDSAEQVFLVLSLPPNYVGHSNISPSIAEQVDQWDMALPGRGRGQLMDCIDYATRLRQTEQWPQVS